jgi:hypothetical protein
VSKSRNMSKDGRRRAKMDPAWDTPLTATMTAAIS